MSTLPLHLAVHVPGCVRATAEGPAITSRIGPLIDALASLVDRTTIVGYDPPPRPGLAERTDYLMSSSPHADVLSLGPLGRWSAYPSRRRRVAKIVRGVEAGWDLLFFPLVNRRAGLVARAAPHPRWVAQIGGHTPSVLAREPLGVGKRRLKWMMAHLAELAYIRIGRRGLFFVNAEVLLDHYHRWVPDVQLLRTSVRSERYVHRQSDRLVGPGSNIAIYGRITPNKGVHDAVQAFARFHAEVDNRAVLHVIGTGDGESDLRMHVAELGLHPDVEWHGWKTPGPELFSLLSHMDVLLTLSRAEALPNAVHEAMAHSVLVVATPVGALPHVFTDGRELLFVPEKDSDAAADALARLFRDQSLRTALLTNAYRAAGAFTVEAVAREMLARVHRRWPDLPDEISA